MSIWWNCGPLWEKALTYEHGKFILAGQLWIWTSDICFIVVSTAGKWSPLCPLQPPLQGRLFIISVIYFLLLLPTFPPVSFLSPSMQLERLSWLQTLLNHQRLPGGRKIITFMCEHLTAQLRQCERGERQKKGTLITFLPPCSPSPLHFKFHSLFMNSEGYFCPEALVNFWPFCTIQTTLLTMQIFRSIILNEIIMKYKIIKVVVTLCCCIHMWGCCGRWNLSSPLCSLYLPYSSHHSLTLPY